MLFGNGKGARGSQGSGQVRGLWREIQKVFFFSPGSAAVILKILKVKVFCMTCSLEEEEPLSECIIP